MTQFKSLVGQYRDKQTEKVKYLNDMIEARRNRVSNLAFRKHILDRQNSRNFSSEYERIRSHLENSTLPFETKKHLQERTEQLKKLGAKSFEIV